MTSDDRWGRNGCVRCGHPAAYHGATFCQVRAGAAEKRACDCAGWSLVHEPTLSEAALARVSPEDDALVNVMVPAMQEAWAKAEPAHDITLYPASFVASYVDMARAALAAIAAEVKP